MSNIKNEDLVKEIDFFRVKIFEITTAIAQQNYSGASFQLGCLYSILETHLKNLKNEIK